jgi:hypothetical protein
MWFSGAEVDAGQALDQRGERKWESRVWGRQGKLLAAETSDHTRMHKAT